MKDSSLTIQDILEAIKQLRERNSMSDEIRIGDKVRYISTHPWASREDYGKIFKVKAINIYNRRIQYKIQNTPSFSLFAYYEDLEKV